MRILIADDDPLIQAMLRSSLESAGYEVVAPGDGKGTITVAKRRDREWPQMRISWKPTGEARDGD